MANTKDNSAIRRENNTQNEIKYMPFFHKLNEQVRRANNYLYINRFDNVIVKIKAVQNCCLN